MRYQTKPYVLRPRAGISIYAEKQELGILVADRYDGDYVSGRVNKPLTDEFHLEDPFIWHDEDGYNMMAKDMDGRICGEPLAGVYARSKDGLHWDFKKDFLFYTRNVLWDDGVIRRMGNMERPFLLFEDGKPICAFFATSDAPGDEGINNVTRTWNMAIPLRF